MSAHGRKSAAVVLVMALAWFALGFWSRQYADGDGPGWACAEWFAHRGKWYVFTVAVLFLLGITLRDRTLSRRRTAVVLGVEVLVIWLLVWRTLPSYLWLSDRDRRDDNGHRRQSIEHTCGPVSLANLLEVCHGQKAPSERELARLSHTTMEGTPLTGLIAAARKLGLELQVCKVIKLAELRKRNTPALVQISTLPSVQHATLLLRIEGDAADFIDPAYGYRRISCERFQKIWYGKTLMFEKKHPGLNRRVRDG